MPEQTVLCGASAYEQKYYFNGRFARLPQAVKEELQVLCVLFTEEVGGVLTLRFGVDGSILLETEFAEDDFYYDEVSSGLMVRAVREKRQELFAALKLYYRVMILQEDVAVLTEDEAE